MDTYGLGNYVNWYNTVKPKIRKYAIFLEVLFLLVIESIILSLGYSI